MSVIDRITADRAFARQDKDTNTYQILTQILGNYQTGATLKKPRVGDSAMIACVREIVNANNETIALLMKANTEGQHQPKIDELYKQTVMLKQYLPTLLTETELADILAAGEYANIGAFQKFLRENHTDCFQPGVAAQVFNANKV